jgi:1,4-alpha-glucan branching enzyme
MRDFLEDGNYQTLLDTLDYLENLGINAIQFMPINEFEGNESWGYNPSFYFAPGQKLRSKIML